MKDKLKQALGAGASVDEKSLGYLCKALERSNQTGFDYLEFKLALYQLQKMDIKGELAVKSAFATASAMGVNKEHILNSLDRYLHVLQLEQQDFDRALESAMKRKIEARKKDITTLQNKIDEYKTEIARIEQAIQEGELKISTASGEIDSATTDLERAEKTFRETYDQIISAIQADRDLIQSIT